MNTKEILKVAEIAAKAGGEVLKKYFRNKITISEKFDSESYNLVTNADTEAEEAILAVIKKHFPDHSILAEESASKASLGDNTWIVDPLDGTNNFAHSIAQFAVSIAFYHQGKALVGIVYNPISEETFSAIKGQGAYLNGEKISVSKSTTLKTSLVCTGFYYDRGQMMQDTLNAIKELFENNIHGIRRMGAASLDLCFTAAGRFDSYFELKLAPWDFAAGALIVEEAGGKVTDCKGQEISAQYSSILASNTLTHQQILEIISKNTS